MLIQMLFDGRELLFAILLFTLIFALTFHEFGHAYVAKLFGDRTAEFSGRLTLNPVAHIDPIGLLMVMMIGFGYAKPVPTNPRNFTSKKADLWVSAAGPGMNLLLAVIAINIYHLGLSMGWEVFFGYTARTFFEIFTVINLVLMLFNLIPLGPLDGHYILPHFLPTELAYKYRIYNAKYGQYFLLGLIALSFLGIPVFSYVFAIGKAMVPIITFF